MIFVVGGLASGKREYIRALGFADSEIADGRIDYCPAIVNAQDLVRDESSNPTAVAALLAGKQVVAYRDVGSGIVPMQKSERLWRERAGLLARELAHRACAVIRMTCGIAQVLKGCDPQTESLELVMMRHGSTHESERRAYTGWLDVPLSERGEQEAHVAGVHPDVEEVFTSTLIRAQQTTHICFPHARQIPVDGLREMNFGFFQGLTADEMAHDAAYRSWVDGGCTAQCPEGEGKDAFVSRTAETIRGIALDTLAAGRKRIIVVAHGGTIMAAMSAFARTRRSYYEWSVKPCEGYRATARIHAGRLSLEDEQRFDSLAFLEAEPGCGREPRPATSAFFQNRDCPHFPCHEGVSTHDFNCLFCYCPLYTLGPNCKGNFTYTDAGRKNCTACTLPHQGENGARLVAAHYEQLAALARRQAD